MTQAEMPHQMAVVPVYVTGQAAAAVHQGVHFTVVVSTGANAVEQLLPRDHDRYEAYIQAVDAPVVLAQTREQAENAANQATSVPNPVGSYLPQSQWVPLRHCDEVWVAATSATACRVSVIVCRRLGDSARPEH